MKGDSESEILPSNKIHPGKRLLLRAIIFTVKIRVIRDVCNMTPTVQLPSTFTKKSTVAYCPRDTSNVEREALSIPRTSNVPPINYQQRDACILQKQMAELFVPMFQT